MKRKNLILILLPIVLLSCKISSIEKSQNVQGFVYFNKQPVEGLKLVLVKVEESDNIVSKEWLHYDKNFNRLDDILTNKDGFFDFESEYLKSGQKFELHVYDTLYEGFIPFTFNYSNNDLVIEAFKNDLKIINLHQSQHIQDLTPYFEWEPYKEASYYTLSLSNYSMKYSVIVPKTKLLNTSFQCNEILKFESHYSVEIDAYTESNTKLAENHLSFYIGEPLVNNSFQGYVKWNNKPLEDVTLYVYDEDNLKIKTTTNSNGYYILTGGNFIHEKRYNIRILNDGSYADSHYDLDKFVAFYSDGNTCNFEIVKKIQIDYPINNSVINDTNPTFKWENLDGIKEYDIVLCKNLNDDGYESYSTINSEFYIQDLQSNTYKHNQVLERGKKYRLLIWGRNEDYQTVVESDSYFEVSK